MAEAKAPNRMEKKKEQTRLKLIEVALKLFAEQGFAATTMEQIAAVADVAKGTLYNHFPSKEDIVAAYVQTVNKQARPAIEDLLGNLPDTRSRLLNVLLQAFDWFELNRELLVAYIVFRLQNLAKNLPEPEERSGFTVILAMIFRQGQRDGEIRRDVAAEYLADSFNMIYFKTLSDWLNKPDEYPLHEQLARDIELFLDGANR